MHPITLRFNKVTDMPTGTCHISDSLHVVFANLFMHHWGSRYDVVLFCYSVVLYMARGMKPHYDTVPLATGCSYMSSNVQT